MVYFDPVCYSVNSKALGDVLAAVPVVKYAIDTYHQTCDYRVVASKYFRDLFHFIPDSKFLELEDDTWKFDKKYSVRRLNDMDKKGGNICRLTPSKMTLSHYASIGLMGRILKKDQYNYIQLPTVDVSKFDVDFSKSVILIVSYRDINRSIPNEELSKISEYIHMRGLIPVYVGKTDKGAWKTNFPVSPFTPPSYGVDLRNQTSILELASIMDKAVAICGVDSGPIHLAGTTSTAIIAGYTNVDWRYRVPIRNRGRTIVIEPDPMDCRYCSSHWLKDFHDYSNCYFAHNNCVKTLRAEKYINALNSIIGDQISERICFAKVWDIIKPSLLGKSKSNILYTEMCMVQNVTGDFAEVGVYKGDTSKLMKFVFPDRHLHCYDSFSGIKNSDKSIDLHKDGEFCASLDKVRNNVGDVGVTYHVGVFPDTFIHQENKPLFAFVHVDLDTYSGTKAGLDYVFPYLAVGGTLLFDDYRWPACLGVERAIQEWLVDNQDKCIVREYKHQCAITKK